MKVVLNDYLFRPITITLETPEEVEVINILLSTPTDAKVEERFRAVDGLFSVDRLRDFIETKIKMKDIMEDTRRRSYK